MSAGLKFIASAINNGAGTAILSTGEDVLMGDQEIAVFDFVKGYYRSYREVPTPTIVQEHTGVRLPRAEGALKFHQENLYDRRDFEILRAGYGDLRELMKEGTPAPVVSVMERTIRRIRRGRRGQNLIDIHQGMGQVITRLEDALRQGGMTGVPAPWDTLNDQTGGYQKADLITLVGRMGTGKTAMMLAQAEHAYDCGYSVLVVTSEMASEQITRRWMAMRYGLNSQALKKGTVSTYLLRRMKGYQSELLGRERFRLLSVGTGAQLSQIEAAIDEVDPDIVFVDGIYLFYPSRGGGYMKLTERVTAVFDELKQMTIDTDKPFVTTTQFNRQAGKGGKEGSMETIGLSDAIGWHSSIVIAVKTGPTENPSESRELDILKGREGESGKFAINFKFKPVDFSEMTPEQLDAIESQPVLNVDTDWT